MARHRDLPRRLALVVLGMYTAQKGAGLILDPLRTPGLAKVPGPIRAWGVVFIVVAALIPLGVRSSRAAQFTSFTAITAWIVWATWIFNAWQQHQVVHGHQLVSGGGVVDGYAKASLFLLLMPYWRARSGES